ncbi:MAG: lipoate--protein ligase family protein [Candidatus Hydrogenedentes bacterium]|nr:lipoate--protein ligase family protein [Candidatus Hydrogenedentota bacterium]
MLTMRLLDVTLATPEENLALDEVLLSAVEEEGAEEVVRVWQSPVPFVVLGVAQAVRAHVHDRACARDGVPVLRRCSAGGCVLQGPGCLNYTLVWRPEHHPEIRTLRGSYCHILGRLSDALAKRGVSARHKGISDLAVSGKKVSGSAQKRRRKAILHHGTLLYATDYDAMLRYLREPAERPQYRGNRTHRGFVRDLPLSPQELREVIWGAFDLHGEPEEVLTAQELRAVEGLVREKYGQAGWNRRK